MIELFEERAAILEYDFGMARYEAETEAARRIGKKRWEMINEISKRNSSRGGNHRQTAQRKSENNMPGM